MKYVLMFVDTEQFAKEVEAMAPAELEQINQRVNQWFIDHADKIRGGTAPGRCECHHGTARRA